MGNSLYYFVLLQNSILKADVKEQTNVFETYVYKRRYQFHFF
jgi:hypothetical protein